MTTPCEWPVDETCLPVNAEESDAAADPVMAAAKDMAVHVLWSLSGRQYGLCERVVRPCPSNYPPSSLRRSLPSTYEIFSWGDGWVFDGCGCGGRCRQSGPGMAHLPGPAVEILEVEVAGLALDESQYTLEGNVLYRIGDAHVWPSQDMSRPAGEPNTWTVTYLRGVPVPPGVDRLTAMLATEFYNACTGGKCRLPRTVTEVSRQGVTHRIVNPNDIYSSGKTGIPEIDLWLSAVNPNHLIAAPSVT